MTFLTNDPFVLEFSEKKEATTTSNTGAGPKFALDQVLINGTKDPWVGFTETLKDHNLPDVTTVTLKGGKKLGGS